MTPNFYSEDTLPEPGDYSMVTRGMVTDAMRAFKVLGLTGEEFVPCTDGEVVEEECCDYLIYSNSFQIGRRTTKQRNRSLRGEYYSDVMEYVAFLIDHDNGCSHELEDGLKSASDAAFSLWVWWKRQQFYISLQGELYNEEKTCLSP